MINAVKSVKHLKVGDTTYDLNAYTAEKLETAKTITLSGDVSGSANFDGSADAIITTQHIDTTRNDTTSTDTGSHGGTVTVVDKVMTNNTGHVTAVNVKTITLPGETELSVDTTNKTSAPAHGDTVTVITGVQKGDSGHNIDVEKTTITLPSLPTGYDSHIANEDIHVTAEQKNTWTTKQNALTAGSGISLSDDTIDTVAKTYIVEFPVRSSGEMTHGDVWTAGERPALASQLDAIYATAVAQDTFNVVMAIGSDHTRLLPCDVSYSTRTQTITVIAHNQSKFENEPIPHAVWTITRSAKTSTDMTCTQTGYYAEMDELDDSSEQWYDAPTSMSVASYVQNKLTTKQDTLVFNTAYNASTNKVATMADIKIAVGQLTPSLTATITNSCMELAFTSASTTLDDSSTTLEDDTSATDSQS